MKTTSWLLACSLVALASCSTTHSGSTGHRFAKAEPETVLVTYHVQAGKEGEFQGVLARAWGIYSSEALVFTEPHMVVRDTEDGGKPRFVEIFTWVSRSIPAHAPARAKTIWTQEELLFET